MLKRRPIVYVMDLLATVPYYTAYLSSALLRHGADIRVGSITYYLDPECFDRHRLKLSPGCLDIIGRIRRLPKTLRRVLKLGEMLLNLSALTIRFLLHPPNVLHVQFLPLLCMRIPLDFMFVRLIQWRGSKVVLTVHDILPHDTADRYRAEYAKLYTITDALICHSEHIRGRLQNEFGISGGKIHVIPHGPFFYDLSEAEGSASHRRYNIGVDQTIFLWQGIILPYKGVDLLLDAWRLVEDATDCATLIVAGTGSPELLADIEERVSRLGLKRVRLDLRFIPIPELMDLYHAASVIIYPYRAITTSGALATGLALGKAVIASDLPAFRELLTDGRNALLVPPCNETLLAEAMTRALHDKQLRMQMSGAVRDMKFGEDSWTRIAHQTASLYTTCVTKADPIS